MNSVTADGLIISRSAGDCLLACGGTIACYFFYISKNERIYLLAGVLTDIRVIFSCFLFFRHLFWHILALMNV